MKKILALLSIFILAISFSFAAARFVKADEEGDNKQSQESDDNDDEDKNDDKDEQKSQGEQAKQEREKIRENFKKQRETLIANLQNEKEEWKTKRAEALEKLKSEKQSMIEAFKEKFTAERCAKIQERVQERTKNFDEKEGKHLKVYANLVNRINKFIARFDEKGLDTAAIKLHVTELQVKIDKFKADYAAYIAKLKESKTLTCGHSEGEFKGTLVEAKALLKTVHADAADIRTYVRTTILKDIKALKAQMPKEEDENDSDDQDESDESDEGDTKIPVVSITAPATGSAYSVASTVAISANATDNKGIAKVEFYDGATLKATDTAAPYSYDWAITVADNGAHSWTAKAYDTATTANTATSAPVSLTVNIAQ